MSKMLSFCNHLLSQGQRLQDLGVDHRALRCFSHLSRLRDLPAEIAEETQLGMAELMLKQRQFAKARRHLAAALVNDRHNAHYHYLMACALQDDRRGDRQQALRHYRQCVSAEPENPRYHCDAGLFALQQGREQEGLSWLRRAVELAPADVELIGDVVRGLQDQGQPDEAQAIARAAMFRNGRDRRFQALWNDLRFQQLHQHQQQADKRRIARRAVAEGRVTLSFSDSTVETPTGRKLLRRDRPSGLPSPHILRTAEHVGRKHA